MAILCLDLWISKCVFAFFGVFLRGLREIRLKFGVYPVNSGIHDCLKCLFVPKTTGFLTNFDFFPVVFMGVESYEAKFFS